MILCSAKSVVEILLRDTTSAGPFEDTHSEVFTHPQRLQQLLALHFSHRLLRECARLVP